MSGPRVRNVAAVSAQSPSHESVELLRDCGRQSRDPANAMAAAIAPAHHTDCQLANNGPPSMASAIPVGMKQLQSPKAISCRFCGANRVMSAGPAIITSVKPRPSTMRVASRSSKLAVAEPAAAARAIAARPTTACGGRPRLSRLLRQECRRPFPVVRRSISTIQLKADQRQGSFPAWARQSKV